jgi:glycolate oxidase FAD binding subunit
VNTSAGSYSGRDDLGDILSPATEAEAAAWIIGARARRHALRITGGGTRLKLGRPTPATVTLSSRALSGITLYEPAEMVISARAGTLLRDLETALAEHGQWLPFEPMDHRAIFRSQGEPTVGAIAACNLSGSRRVVAGAARDCLIGLRLVNGRGEIVRAGGRVVKNVTGLDLVKLNAGAYGTLGLICEVTFKVMPRPERAATLVLSDLTDQVAIEALSIALCSPFEISGAAHLPAGRGGPSARTLIRVEHFRASVDYRAGELRRALAAYGPAQLIEGVESARLWQAVRDVEVLAEPSASAIWRVSLAPSDGPKFIARLQVPTPHFYDWGGGLVWLSQPDAGDAGAASIRAVLNEFGGHATLVRAATAIRAAVPVFQPLPESLMRITSGLKASFDPDRIINPGKMYAGV